MSTQTSAEGFGPGEGGGAGLQAGGGTGQDGHGGHASPGFYWTIGGILTVMTAVEVAVFYIPALSSVLVPLLLGLSAAKFTLVVMFFMHLKFDSRVFSGVFTAGLMLAAFMVVALVILFKVLPDHPIGA